MAKVAVALSLTDCGGGARRAGALGRAFELSGEANFVEVKCTELISKVVGQSEVAIAACV